MGGSLEILRYGVRRQLRSTVVWALSVAAYCLAVAALWPSIRNAGLQQLTKGLPEGWRQAFGVTDLGTAPGYLSAELFSFVLPLLLIVAAILTASALTAADEDSGRMEMVLALPVSRTRVFLQRCLTGLGEMSVITALSVLGIVAAAGPLGLGVSTGLLLAAGVVAGMLALFHGALVVGAAGLGADRRLATGIAAAVAVVGYLADLVAKLVPSLSPLEYFSPWYWLASDRVLTAGPDTRTLLVAGGVILLVVAVGAAGNVRRDVRSA